MLHLIFFLMFSQNSFEREINMPFVKVDVVNSANNCFKKECVEYWLKNWIQIPVVLVTGDREEIIGKAVCAHMQNDWIVAKILINQPIPETFVLRPHSKPIKVETNDGCFFDIKKAELVRLLLVSPVLASKYPDEKPTKILIGN